MATELNQDPTPYFEMKKLGATPGQVFRKAKQDGYRNFDCIALISGVFDISLSEAREISHAIHKEDSGEA